MRSDSLEHLLSLVRQNGADAADGLLVESTDMEVSHRLGKPEKLNRAESKAIAVRALVGQKQAMVSTTDFSTAHLKELAQQAVAIARESTEDPYVTLAPEALLAKNPPALELYDPLEPDVAWLNRQCEIAEDAARAVAGVTNSEGAEASYSAYTLTLGSSIANSGFTGSYKASAFSISASVLAGTGVNMERDYDYSTARFRSDLLDPVTIGKKTGERAVKRLNPRKVKTCEAPVIFDPRAGRSLLHSFASAINGNAIARGTSFLKDAIGQPVFSSSVTIIDEPHRQRGLGSKPFDGEGVQNMRHTIVQDGRLNTWLLDIRSANRLGLQTTGHASRSLTSPPSPAPTNFYMQAGSPSADELIQSVNQGLYVTDVFGMGVNVVTGDYSQGASGFWIENGEITYPVSEITIAGKLQDMFLQLMPANDLEFKSSINTPTFLISRMTVAGN